MARKNGTTKSRSRATPQRPKSSKAPAKPRAKKVERHYNYQSDLPAGFLQNDNPNQSVALTGTDVTPKDHHNYQDDLPAGFSQNTNPGQSQTF